MKEDFGIIFTKLKIPVPRRNYILRKHLHKKLDSICQYKVTMVKGAAGSGKTTLLSTYIKENEPASFRWITLDEDNNNIFSFWHYFLEVVSSFLGESGENLAASFKAALHKEDLESLLALLINQLDIQEEIVVVLDDFQKIQDASLIRTMEFFIRYSSDNVHLVLFTRANYILFYTISILLVEKVISAYPANIVPECIIPRRHQVIKICNSMHFPCMLLHLFLDFY